MATIRKSTRRGQVRWVVHVRDESKGNAKPYRELTFRSRVEAEDFVEARERERSQLGEALLTLSPAERADIAEAMQIARKGGFRLVDAARAMSAQRESPTLQDAFGEYYAACKARGVRQRSLESIRHFPKPLGTRRRCCTSTTGSWSHGRTPRRFLGSCPRRKSQKNHVDSAGLIVSFDDVRGVMAPLA